MNEPPGCRWIRRAAAAALLTLGRAAPLYAQGGGGVAPSTRSHLVDIVLFVLLVGAALFAVCRSSNRS